MEKCIATITVNAEEPKPPTFEDLGFEQVVHCKDCKFGEACKNGRGEHGVMCYNSHSASHGWVHEPDWFCADGERKSADEILMDEMDADPLG